MHRAPVLEGGARLEKPLLLLLPASALQGATSGWSVALGPQVVGWWLLAILVAVRLGHWLASSVLVFPAATFLG